MMTGIFDPVFSDYSPATGISIRSRMTHTYVAKSGSTNSDQWLIGFTPKLTAGVWNGYDQGKTLPRRKILPQQSKSGLTLWKLSTKVQK